MLSVVPCAVYTKQREATQCDTKRQKLQHNNSNKTQQHDRKFSSTIQIYKMQRQSHNQPYFTDSEDNSKDTEKRIERKIEDVLEEDQFGFRRGKGTRDTIGMMRIIAERTLELDEKLCIEPA
jgi:hypothetical protein